MRPEDSERIVSEVVSRVVSRIEAAAENGGPTVEESLADCVYHERKRIEQNEPPRARGAQLSHWRDVQRRNLRASERERRALLREVTAAFASEVLGHFDPRVYAVATTVVPVGLRLLLNALSPARVLQRLPSLPDIKDNVLIRGDVERLRALEKRGTIVLCPTHLSNLDSIVVGWVLHRLELPPFTYGAGLNLFSNPIVSFFMHHLGAYKVDRKKSAPLYKDVLKEYATVSIELGYHNLFFPGGTRSRSGGVERKLKLGLLGAGLNAYVSRLRAGAPRPDVFVVPCTISYELVLEAENLIEDFLKETGRSRFIIEDDEFSQPRRVWNFISSVLSLDMRIYLTFSEALDVFGNVVSADGVSHDARGRAVDRTRYVRAAGGEPAHDPARDREYTRELGEAVVRRFRKDNVALATHLVALVAFERLRRRRKRDDLWRFLREAEGDDLALTDAEADLAHVLARARSLEADGAIRLDERLAGKDAPDVLREALRAFGTYHTRPVLERKGDRVVATDTNLLLYYRNRVEGYGLEEALP